MANQQSVACEALLRAERRVYTPAASGDVQELSIAQVSTIASPQARAELRAAVEEMSHGENTVIFDDAGVPSVMVRIPAMRVRELLPGSTNDAYHPAFLWEGRVLPEIWVGKYLACVSDGQAASLPMARPHRAASFDEAFALSRKKGRGWMLMPFQVRMAIALSCLQSGVLPGGNNQFGHDFFHPDETGIPVGDGTVLTGSGPLQWTHNGTPRGIWDMNGNLNEWDAGFRVLNGEIQLTELKALYDLDAPPAPDQPCWRAMDRQGRLCAPGTPGTLHYDVPEERIRLADSVEHHGIGNCAFRDIQTQGGLSVPAEAVLWGFHPDGLACPQTAGWRWVGTEGEVLPLSGGAYGALDHAGVLFAGITKQRGLDYALGGMRFIYLRPDDLEEE